jgi:hypothetical protein
MKKQIVLSLLALTIVGCANDFYYENGKKVEVTKLKEKRNNRSETTYYKTSSGHKVGVTDEILVQCSASKDCEKVLEKYKLSAVSRLSDEIFLVKITKDKNIFEISQKLYEDANITSAHPNFLKTKKRR